MPLPWRHRVEVICSGNTGAVWVCSYLMSFSAIIYFIYIEPFQSFFYDFESLLISPRTTNIKITIILVSALTNYIIMFIISAHGSSIVCSFKGVISCDFMFFFVFRVSQAVCAYIRTVKCATCRSYIIRPDHLARMTVSRSDKNASISHRRPLFTSPKPCETCFNIDARALFDYFWTVEQKHPPPTPILKLGRARNMFYYNSDWIRLKEESHIHLGCFEAE